MRVLPLHKTCRDVRDPDHRGHQRVEYRAAVFKLVIAQVSGDQAHHDQRRQRDAQAKMGFLEE